MQGDLHIDFARGIYLTNGKGTMIRRRIQVENNKYGRVSSVVTYFNKHDKPIEKKDINGILRFPFHETSHWHYCKDPVLIAQESDILFNEGWFRNDDGDDAYEEYEEEEEEEELSRYSNGEERGKKESKRESVISCDDESMMIQDIRKENSVHSYVHVQRPREEMFPDEDAAVADAAAADAAVVEE